jgi:iron complex transport system substrate-binding protein
MSVAPTAQRVVSILPSATELLIALGQASLLMARTDYDTQPELSGLPSLGPTLAPSVERIVELGPDLVITAADELSGGLATHLTSLGLRVFESSAQDLEGVLSTMSRVSVLVGVPERGEALRESVVEELVRVRRDGERGRGRTRVMYLLWHEPPYVAGRDTYIDELIRAVGAENVFEDVHGWGNVSFEDVLTRQPEVIIVPRGEGSLDPAWLSDAPRWQNVRAVRDGRLVVVDSDLFNRPGPRVVEAARALARGLRGERGR